MIIMTAIITAKRVGNVRIEGGCKWVQPTNGEKSSTEYVLWIIIHSDYKLKYKVKIKRLEIQT